MILRLIGLWKDERGVGKVTIFSIVFPLFTLCMLAGLYWGIVAHAKGVALQAAREAGRTAAVYHDLIMARQKAIDTVSQQLPAPEGAGGTTGEPDQPFDPDDDVVITEDSTYVYATVSYHVFCPIPGFPKLFNNSATPWERWANVSGFAAFQKEYQP